MIKGREKLSFDNEELEQQQKKIQKEINKMAQSKEVMERNIHACDEDAKWQLPEPGMLMTAKSHREKNVVPLVTKLKESVKCLTIKCVRLTEENKKLKAKTTKQAKDVEFYKSRMRQQSSELEQLQEKADDFKHVKQYAGADKIGAIITNAREWEKLTNKEKQHNRIYDISR